MLSTFMTTVRLNDIKAHRCPFRHTDGHSSSSETRFADTFCSVVIADLHRLYQLFLCKRYLQASTPAWHAAGMNASLSEILDHI